MIQAVTPHMMETLESTIVNVESITALILCSQYLNQIFEKLNISTKLILKKLSLAKITTSNQLCQLLITFIPQLNMAL